MSKKKSAPPPPPAPKYVEPKPVPQLMPSAEEENYLKQLRSNLANPDMLNPYFNAREQSFNTLLANQMNNVYNPMMQQTMNNVANRFGGLNNSVYRDMALELNKQRSKSIADASRQYQMQTMQDRMNWETFNQNMINSILDRYYKANTLGLAMANPKNQYNLGSYNNQLGYLRATARPPSSPLKDINNIIGTAHSAAMQALPMIL